MKKRKLAAMIIALLLTLSLGGCGLIKPVRTATPAPTPSQTSSPTIAPPPDETMEPEPTDEPEDTPFTGDVKAYLQAGLPARDKMTAGQRWYYYDRDDDEADHDKYNTEFEGSTKADLDGDGKQDDISLTFPDAGNNVLTSHAVVNVNGKKLNIAGLEGWDFADTGTITDIDASDGKKELCIDISTDDYGATYVVVYEQGKLLLLPGLMEEFSYANGTGYITRTWISQRYGANLYVEEPLKLKKDHMGFENAGFHYYVAMESNFPEKDANWDAAETAWTQKLAKAPGGNEAISVKKETLVYLGLYDPKGWLQILDEEGNTLGWLDVKKTDPMKYIDNAIGIG